MKKYSYLILILIIFACKSDIELAMDRGIQYFEWGKIEKSILEFKYVIHNLSSDSRKVNYENIKLLSRAHYNLAVAMAKKGTQNEKKKGSKEYSKDITIAWYKDAILEAKKAFELIPTDENRMLIGLIQNKVKY